MQNSTGTANNMCWCAYSSVDDVGDPYEPVAPTPTPKPIEPDPTEPTTDPNTTIYNYTDNTYNTTVDFPSLVVSPTVDVDLPEITVNVPTTPAPTTDIGGDATDVTGWLSDILAAINALRSENSQNLGMLITEISDDADALNGQINGGFGVVKAYLSQILSFLGTATQAIQSSLLAVKNEVSASIDDLESNLGSVIQNRISWLADNLNANIDAMNRDLLTELRRDAEWIVDNLEYGSEFDDSDIVRWLKQIYVKLNKNPTGIRDPTADPTGWFDDIKEAIEKLLAGLLAGIDLTETLALLDELKLHFPFSIPWDVLAIATMLVHEPIVPALDMPLMIGEQEITRVQFDLSAYEDVAEVSRTLSLALFSVGLLLNMDKFLSPMTESVERKG